METAQQASKKYFLKQSDFLNLCNRATALSKEIWSEKKVFVQNIFLKQFEFQKLRNSATKILNHIDLDLILKRHKLIIDMEYVQQLNKN